MILLVTLVTFLYALYLLRVYYANEGNLAAFPGPTPLSLVGSALTLDIQRIYVTFTELSLRYGGVYKVGGFGREALIVSSPEVFREALVTRGREFAGREKLHRIVMAGQEGNIADLQPGRVWSKLRRQSYQCVSRLFCENRLYKSKNH